LAWTFTPFYYIIITSLVSQVLSFVVIYIIKEFVQPKMSLNREFLIWKERGRVCEIERGGRGCEREG
jgi:hypothetical protein